MPGFVITPEEKKAFRIVLLFLIIIITAAVLAGIFKAGLR